MPGGSVPIASSDTHSDQAPSQKRERGGHRLDDLIFHAALGDGQLELVGGGEKLITGEVGQDVALGEHRWSRVRLRGASRQGGRSGGDDSDNMPVDWPGRLRGGLRGRPPLRAAVCLRVAPDPKLR